MRPLMQCVLLCALVMGTVPARAAMYKWVNENGETVYSQTPPPSGMEGVEKIKAPPRPPTSSGAETQKTKENGAALDERQDEKKTAQQDQKKIQQADAERKELCDKINRNLEMLTDKPVVRRTDEKGEIVVMTTEEREAEVKKLRERKKNECK